MRPMVKVKVCYENQGLFRVLMKCPVVWTYDCIS